ncbi:DUF4198 domain-containing protein [Hellea balneolensis]|uniref:DUF4198 domain-containing protein n=1 Tax=Hellea balneolensis TaxID=287478 RepID=UPI0003F51C2A|nr:DUF4198 domain-containing protein [Hellea balneolensis]
MTRLITSLFFGTALSLSLSTYAQAHDFWLAPQNYYMEKARPIPLAIMIGHPQDKSRWSLSPHRVVSLSSLGPNGITDHQNRMTPLTPTGDVILSLKDEGTHMVMIETTSAVSILPPEKFTDYVNEEGLTPIIAHRSEYELNDEDGREIYSRRGKALVQIGDMTDQKAAYVTRPVGMTLEIVPQVNPYALKAGAELTSTVYYRGNPIEGVSIGLISLDTEKGLVRTQITNAEGQVSFDRPVTGQWMLHAVWSDPMENTLTADYDTIFSSLSFGFNN